MYQISIDEINANINLFNMYNLFYRALDVYCEKYKDSPFSKDLMKFFEKEDNNEYRIDNDWTNLHKSNKLIHIGYSAQNKSEIILSNLEKLDNLK